MFQKDTACRKFDFCKTTYKSTSELKYNQNDKLNIIITVGAKTTNILVVVGYNDADMKEKCKVAYLRHLHTVITAVLH